MSAEARITPLWKKQKLMVSVILLGFSLPFFYDGSVGYEKKNQRYLEWKKFHDAKTELQLPADAKTALQWSAYAKERDWDPEEWRKYIREHPLQPNQVPFPRGKIIEQFVCAGLCLIFGGITLAYWAGQKGRTVRTDPDAVFTPAGTRVPFSAITGVGKKKWDAKGLATVRFQIDGRKGEFLLDDYKFDRDATHKILAEIEEHLPAGEPEPESPKESAA